MQLVPHTHHRPVYSGSVNQSLGGSCTCWLVPISLHCHHHPHRLPPPRGDGEERGEGGKWGGGEDPGKNRPSDRELSGWIMDGWANLSPGRGRI